MTYPLPTVRLARGLALMAGLMLTLVPTTTSAQSLAGSDVTWVSVADSPRGLQEVSADDTFVWAVTAGGSIHRRPVDGSGQWEQITGSLSDVSASGNGWVWGIQGENTIWKCRKPCAADGSGWVQVDGNAVQISANDTHVWVTNAGGEGYRRPVDGSGQWERMNGPLWYVAASNSEWIWGRAAQVGTGAQGSIVSCRRPCAADGTGWQNVGRYRAAAASANASHVWIVDNTGYTWVRPVDGSGAWSQVRGSYFRYISASNAGWVWGTNAQGSVFKASIPANASGQTASTGGNGQVATGDITITSCTEGQRLNSARACAPEVFFHPTYLDPQTAQRDAMVMARERAWVLASVEEVQQAWQEFGLNVPSPGMLRDGTIATPVQQDSPAAGVSRGTNIGTNVRQPDGFFYVLETAVPRVQSLPVAFDAPDWWPTPVGYVPSGGLPGSTWRSIPEPTYAQYWSAAPQDQHPARALFGLGDAILMREAARQQLVSKGQASTPAAVNALLETLRTDAAARYRFAPFLLGAAFEALSTPTPNAGQTAFRGAFELYLSYQRYRVNGITYDRWRDFNGANPFAPQTGYGYGSPAANFLPNTPDVRGFQAGLTNPMYIGTNGLEAIRQLIEPAAAAHLPEFRNSALAAAGADLNAVVAGVGIGTGAGVSAATLGLVSTAVLAGEGLRGPLIAVVTQAGTLTGKSAGLTVGAAGGIGIGVSLAMAALIAKAIAEQAQADALDRDLRHQLDIGPQPADVYTMLTSVDEQLLTVNRSAMFSYLLKMMIADPVDDGLLTIAAPEFPGAMAAPAAGFTRIQNKWYPTRYVHNENDALSVGDIQAAWWSAQWRIVPEFGDWMKIQNRWRPDQYLHNQRGTLEVGPLGDPAWWSAQWRMVPAGDGWVRIQNRWRPDQYIHNQNGRLEVGLIEPNWSSALWKVE